MYRYDHYDQGIVQARVAQFRDQTRRYLAGKLTDDEFRPLRLQNGLYIERNGPMLRIAVPYGLLSPAHMFAMKYQRFAHEYGVKQEAQRAIALASYAHAQSNPRAVMYGRPLDRELITEAIRQSDLLLVHYADQSLLAALSPAGGSMELR